jgi:hypothetical protein
MKIKKDSASEGEYNDARVQPSKYSGVVLEHQTAPLQTLELSGLGFDPVASNISPMCKRSMQVLPFITDYKLLFSRFEGVGFRQRKKATVNKVNSQA